MEEIVQPCYVCNTGNVGGAHKCCECGNNVHIFCGTAVSGSDEGYGQQVTCFNCKPNKVSASISPDKTTQQSTSKDSDVSAFDVLMVRSGTIKPVKVVPKRDKSGHGSTTSGICVTCYNSKRRCTLVRFNKSTTERHINTVHQPGEKIDVISFEDPRAVPILKELNSVSSKRHKDQSTGVSKSKKRKNTDNTISCSPKSKYPRLHSPSSWSITPGKLTQPSETTGPDALATENEASQNLVPEPDETNIQHGIEDNVNAPLTTTEGGEKALLINDLISSDSISTTRQSS